MLEDRDINLIKKCYVLSSLSIAFFILSISIGFYWVLLVMIDDIIFNSTYIHKYGLFLYLTIVLIYFILFIYSFLYTKTKRNSEDWMYLSDKAWDILSRKNYFNSSSGYLNINSEDIYTPKTLAKVFDLELPKIKKYVILIIFAPIILLTAVYIPKYADSINIANNKIEIASDTMYQLRDTFEKNCEYYFYDDPNERYQSYGYDIFAYLNDIDLPYNSYIVVTVDNEGKVSDVSYNIDIDVNADKKYNIEKIKSDISTLNKYLKQANVPVYDSKLLNVNELPQDFYDMFSENSYYEELNYSDDDIYIYYNTYSEEEYDEYSSSYIYVSINYDYAY